MDNSYVLSQSPVLLKKKFRFVVDVEVTVRDYPRTALKMFLEDGHATKENEHQANEDPERYKEYLELQTRLLDAVVKDQRAVSAFLLDDAGLAAHDVLAEEYTRAHDDEDSTDKALRLISPRLSPADRAFLEDVEKNGVLYENTEDAFSEPFSAKVLGFSATEIKE